MAEQDTGGPGIGTVAQEAARLLDALGSWASTDQGRAPAAQDSPSADSGHPPRGPAVDEVPVDAGEVPVDLGDTGSGEDEWPATPTARCGSCGAAAGVGRATSCQVCPVCQGIALLRSVRPETVERIADLASTVAAALRDLATQRRADAGGGPDTAADEQRDDRAGHRRTTPVEDIRVSDGTADDESLNHDRPTTTT